MTVEGRERLLGGLASKDAREFLRDQMEPVAKTLPSEWLKAKTEAEQFAAFQQLSDYRPGATTSRSVLCHHLPISPVYAGLKNRIRSRRSP